MIVAVVVVGFAHVIFFFSSGVLDFLGVGLLGVGLGLLADLGLGVVVCTDLGVVVEPWV